MIIRTLNQALRFFQGNRTKVFGEKGSIWSTFNVDVQSDSETLKISPRLRINTSGVSNQGRCVAIQNFDSLIFAICGTRVFKTSAQNLLSGFTEDASTGAITTYDPLYSDMKLFNSTLVTTGNSKVMSKATGSGAWTLRATLSATTGIHKLCYFQRQDRIYYFDGDGIIKSLSTGWSEATSGPYSLSLSPLYGIFNTMDVDLDNMWIGTINITPANTLNLMKGASVLRWDGITSGAVFEYKIQAAGVLALCKDDSGVMHAMDTNGALLRNNGGSFVEIGRLPIDKKLLKNAMVYGYANFIHPNGFTFTQNGTFKVLVNNLVGDSGATVLENFPSGVWEWSKEKGFVHANAVTLNTLANSTITDFGQNRVSAVGALYEPNIYSESASGKPTLICGVDYYTDATTIVSGIFVDDPLDTLQKYGYFVTNWIFSNSLKDTWNKTWLKVRQLLSATSKIVVKYRIREASAQEISITWVDTNSFTTATDISALTGYEVEVLQGTGSGKCSHITAVTGPSGGLYTATVDETYTGVTTGTAKARLQAWKKCGSFSNQDDEDASFTIDKEAVRVQIKVCLLSTGEEDIFSLDVVNKPTQPLA